LNEKDDTGNGLSIKMANVEDDCIVIRCDVITNMVAWQYGSNLVVS